MSAITDFLYQVLSFINGIVGNYGVSIIIFTFLMRLVCMPFDYRSRKGMRKMQLLQPELERLQKKYANDKQKYQQKQAELMRKEHYNPLSGCLPMLLTWPLMIAMFAAMRSIANEQLALQAFRFLAGEDSPIKPMDHFLWIKNIWMTDSPFASVAPDAQSLGYLTRDVWQKAYAMLNEGQLAAISQSLSVVPNATLSFVDDAAMKASVAGIVEALKHVDAYAAAVQPVPGWTNINFILGSITVYVQFNGLLIMPALAGVTQVLQTKINPQSQGEQKVGNDQQKGMTAFMKYFFPILSVWFCLTSNAGFAVYWVTSNVVVALQGIVITKMLEKQGVKKAEAVSGEGSVK